MSLEVAGAMISDQRTCLEYELAKSIYVERGIPRNFGDVITAAKRKMHELLVQTAKAFPDLAPAQGRGR